MKSIILFYWWRNWVLEVGLPNCIGNVSGCELRTEFLTSFDSHQTPFFWCYFSQSLSKNSTGSLWTKYSVLLLENTGRKINLMNIQADRFMGFFLKKSDSGFLSLLKKLVSKFHFKGQKLFMDILRKHFSTEKWRIRHTKLSYLSTNFNWRLQLKAKFCVLYR